MNEQLILVVAYTCILQYLKLADEFSYAYGPFFLALTSFSHTYRLQLFKLWKLYIKKCISKNASVRVSQRWSCIRESLDACSLGHIIIRNNQYRLL